MTSPYIFWKPTNSKVDKPSKNFQVRMNLIDKQFKVENAEMLGNDVTLTLQHLPVRILNDWMTHIFTTCNFTQHLEQLHTETDCKNMTHYNEDSQQSCLPNSDYRN